MNNIINIDNLKILYNTEGTDATVNAVDGVSMAIEKGSFVAIVGKNGSGKSTLAKSINALLLPSGGKVYVEGFDTSEEEDIWEIRKTVGMVFQNPDNQLVSTIVEDDVAFGPENLGIEPAEIRKRVDSALNAVGMYSQRKKAPHLLSGGQKQRVAIAGAVAMEPQCIIFDEPTAMLDPSGRKEVMNIVHALHKKGITVVLITHFMEEAVEADEIMVMDKGKVVLQGTPTQIFSKTDEIKLLELDLPPAAELAYLLRKEGMDIPSDIIREEELVKYLCRYE